MENKKANFRICTIPTLFFLATSLLLLTTHKAKAEDTLFSRYIAMGDSITHGVMGGGVDETRQPFVYPALLAEKMDTYCGLPLLKFPGYILNMEDLFKGNIRWWQYLYPLAGGVRRNPGAKITNYSFSGAQPENYRRIAKDVSQYAVLSVNKKKYIPFQRALSKKPTFITYWLGNNDILGQALSCSIENMRNYSRFSDNFQYEIEQIKATTSVQGVVLFNVPDVSSIAYLDEVDDPDYPEGSKQPFWLTQVAGGMVLTPSDQDIVRERIEKINDEIEETAYANDWALVDINQIYSDILKNDRELKNSAGQGTGRYISVAYLGGLFSLDGVHPSVTGHAVITNVAIDVINEHYGQKLEYIDEYKISEQDTLFKQPVDPRKRLFHQKWFSWIIRSLVDSGVSLF